MPNHQFGFRQRHSTIEQTHRIVQRINEAQTIVFSGFFLDISQAFDKAAYWTAIQIKIVSPSKLFPNPKILPA
jgi:hypothetical protein